jgi:amino acid adenylation domain-containing protein
MIQTQLSPRQQRLAELLRAKGRRKTSSLSLSQQRLWFLSELVRDTTSYNIPSCVRLRGQISIATLKQSFAEVVRRHEILRVTIAAENGTPVQTVHREDWVRLELIDLRCVPEPDRETVTRVLQQEEAAREFDLATGPLLRVKLLLIGADDYVLLMTIHHIVSDGWSQGVLLREIKALQSSFAKGSPSTLPELAIQYSDYAQWQHSWVESETYREHLAYWRMQLRDMEELRIPTDRPRPHLQTFRGATEHVIIKPSAVDGARELARAEQATLYMTLLAAFVSLLCRYSGQNRIVIGTATANRKRPETESLIGLFVNMLVLNVTVEPTMTFRDVIRQARQVCLGAYANDEFPFEKLVQDLQPERDLARNPFFQVAFIQLTPLDAGSAEQTSIRVFSGGAKFDLIINVQEEAGRIELLAEYSTDLFDSPTVSCMLNHFGRLLGSAVCAPDHLVGRLLILTPEEVRQMVSDWNDTTVSYDREAGIHTLVEAQASRTPDAVAVVSNTEVLTYSQVETAANRVANCLRRLGAGRGTKVAVLLRRSADMIITLVGILKSSGMYVPIDVSYPPARIAEIINALSIEYLVAHSAELPVIAGLVGQLPSLKYIITPDSPRGDSEEIAAAGQSSIRAALVNGDDLSQETSIAPVNLSCSDDFAYVIFTSGSTGSPKGVVMSHRPVINLIEWIGKEFGVGPNDEALFITSLCFDLSVYDIFGLLAAGGSIRVASSDETQDPRALADLLLGGRVTFWDSAPAALEQVMHFLPDSSAPDSAVRLVFLSGDWIPVSLPDRIRRICAGAEVVALGGATEATVWSNFHRVRLVDPTWPSIPYGRPIQNARYYILEGSFAPAPRGVAGDLYIGGECLFTEYAQDARLTANKLIPDPFNPSPGARMYQTGDRARFWGDGTIEFLGRADHQVKVRGYRIEPEEVQVRLNQLENVSQGVVIAFKDPDGGNQLAAFYVSRTGAQASADSVRSQLQGILPEYMVPSRIMSVPSIPLNANGKVDRSALAHLALTYTEDLDAFVAPATPVEQILETIWREALKLEKVSVDRNFFELGGHSLLAAKVVARISEAFQIALPLRMIFEFPTISALALQIMEALEREVAAMSDEEVELANI